jgi:hypothetical protein
VADVPVFSSVCIAHDVTTPTPQAAPPGAWLRLRPSDDAPDEACMKVSGVTAEYLASMLRESEQGASLEVYVYDASIVAHADANADEPPPKRRRDVAARDARGGAGGEAGGALPQGAAAGAPQTPAVAMQSADVAAGAAHAGAASAAYAEPPLVSKRAAAARALAAAASPPAPSPPAAPAPHASTTAAAGTAGASRPAAGFFTISRLGGEQRFHNCAALQAALQEGDVATLRGAVRGPLSLTRPRVMLAGAPSTAPTLLAPRDAAEATLSVQADGVSVCALAIDAPASRPTTRLEQLSAVDVGARVTEFTLEDVTITGEGKKPTTRRACPCMHASAQRTRMMNDRAMRCDAVRCDARRGRLVRQHGR